jgi:hypothetical protein
MKQKYPKHLKKGMEFGRLTVVGVDENSKIDKEGDRVKPSQWKYFCKCSCPTESVICAIKQNLVSGHTTSCGCYRIETAKESGSANSKTNPIEDCDDYVKIFFFNEAHGYTIIDKEDYIKVRNYCWYCNGGYADTREDGKLLRMHRIILDADEGTLVDHRDRNPLNNRTLNLRICDKSQNAINTKVYKNNTSGIKGVHWSSKNNRWIAQISINKKRHHIGSFTDFNGACKARQEFEKIYYKESPTSLNQEEKP